MAADAKYKLINETGKFITLNGFATKWDIKSATQAVDLGSFTNEIVRDKSIDAYYSGDKYKNNVYLCRYLLDEYVQLDKYKKKYVQKITLECTSNGSVYRITKDVDLKKAFSFINSNFNTYLYPDMAW